MGTLYAYPASPATEAALRPAGRPGEVLVDTSLNLFDLDRETWSTPTQDAATGQLVQLRRYPCGGGCYCAAEVRLAPTLAPFTRGSLATYDNPDDEAHVTTGMPINMTVLIPDSGDGLTGVTTAHVPLLWVATKYLTPRAPTGPEEG